MTVVLDIETIADPEALAVLAPDWWDLWERLPTATPFQSPAWLIPWWNSFAPGRLMTVAVRHEERLVALAPLYLETGPLGPRLLPVGISVSDYLDILIDPGSADAIDGIAEHLSRCGEWENCELSCLLPRSAALALPCPAGCSDTRSKADTCPILRLSPETSDAGTHPAIPGRQRRKLRMARHRLSRGPASSIISTKSWPAETWLETLIGLHTMRWHERSESGVLADSRTRAFHRDALPELIDRGIARLFALIIGDELAGVYYGFSDHSRACAYIGGFNPRFSYYSPGTVLLGHAIEDALREGVAEFHFLRGGEAYKYAWGAVDQFTFRRTFSRSRARA